MTHDDHERFHDDCSGCRAEMDESYREAMGSYRAERQQRESLAIAREDLDMPYEDERDVMDAVLVALK
jgi:hypothetical protein